MNSPIFLKLLLAALLLMGLTVFAIDHTLVKYTSDEEFQSVAERLKAEGPLLVPELRQVPDANRQLWVQNAARRANARITLIGANGQMAASSDVAQDAAESPDGRPEVDDALRGKSGVAVREGTTPGINVCYAATPYKANGGRAVLRLAAPIPPAGDALYRARLQLAAISLGSALLALLIAYLVSRDLSRRIRQLKIVAGNLLNQDRNEWPISDSHDELGSLERFLSAITVQLRELVARLQLESARSEAILSSMAEGVLAVDGSLHVTFCNDSFVRLIGLKPPVLQGLPILELVRDTGLLDILTRVVESGESIKQRLQVRPASGRSFELQAAPLETGAGRGALAVLHDTTDLERLEQVRKDFVANVSHEMRTPLAAIAGYAETLLDGALGDEENNRKFVEVIQAHAIRLNSISTDLLVLSELEAGVNPGELGSISVREALENALTTVESEARVRGVKIVRGDIQNAAVMGNQIRLEQALLNLIDNAVKFNRPAGEVRIDAGTTPEGEVFIRIADTGVGIPFETLPRIFERFYRVDKARSRQVGGTGLGLSIVKHIIERMGGKIAVESQLGKGSTFTVLLPAMNNIP